jgi:transcriptional regulator with XRE-family HTH domain
MLEPSSLRAEALLAASHARLIGLTQSEISVALGASQSQVSRVLAGTSKRRSRLFDEVCKYVFSARGGSSLPAPPAELTEALSAIWDGTPEHTKALTLVIRSLGALRATPAKNISKRAASRDAT